MIIMKLNREALLIGLSLIIGLVFSNNASAQTTELIKNNNMANFQDFFIQFLDMLKSLFKFS